MRLIQYHQQPDGLLIETTSGFMKLTPVTSSIIRVRYTLQDQFSVTESLIIDLPPGQAAPYSISETGDDLICSTENISICIKKNTCAFIYMDAAGNILTKEPARGGKTLAPVDVVKSVFDASTEAEMALGVDGVRSHAENVRQVVDRQAYHTKLEFEWADGEALYGLGSHEEGMMNLRGQHQYLYQHNMKAVIPVLVSTNGYGILVDSCSLMTFHDDAFGSYLWTDIDDEMDYYFIYGPEFDQIVRGIRHLTGKAPMLPRWAWGYVQSKERYVSQDELVAVVQEYRERELPLDCIVLDWQSWPGKLWGQKSFDATRFPDPDGMMDELHRLNARLMISIWPIMNPGGDNHQEMQAQDYLLGNQATYDAFNPQARALYWQQANTGLFCHGIDAWWCDCTEPFEADWKVAIKSEPEARMQINAEEAKRYLDPEYINAYSLQHSRGIYEGQRQVTDRKRVINLTRSAYAGQHRYATITWSGDIVANWETLRRQIPAGLNFCAAGSPYWTLDIGAFFVQDKPEFWFWSGDYDQGVADMGYRELYVRWFQYGAFLPMFRSHGTDTPREVWRFGEPGDPMYDALVRFLRLRYRLIPYIYSLAGLVTQNDDTMLRPLAFDFRHDPNTFNIADQFMFGPAFLVCPVTHPMFYMAGSIPLEDVSQTRPVYLPAGCDWYDFWTGERIAGGQTITAPAGLDIIPLYVRAGSIVPFGPDIQYTGQQPNASIDLYVYPGQDGSFTFYNDEGDSYDYENGAFVTIPMYWEDTTHRLVLEQWQGRYPSMPDTWEFRIIFPGETPETAQRTVIYTGKRIVVD